MIQQNNIWFLLLFSKQAGFYIKMENSVYIKYKCSLIVMTYCMSRV